MPPKESKQHSEAIQTKGSNLPKHLYQQFMALISYLRSAPKIVLEVFAPFVLYLGYEKYKNEDIVKASLDSLRAGRVPSKVEFSGQNQKIFQNIVKMLGLYQLYQAITSKRAKIISFLSSWQQKFQQDEDSLYEQSINVNITRPGYYLSQQIAKHQAKIQIGSKIKEQEQKQSFFYKDPRFIDKLAELIHWRTNHLHKGQIALLEYSGNFIVGKRTYVVAKDSYFQLWQKTSQKYPYPFYQQNADFIKAGKDSDDDSFDPIGTAPPKPKSFELQRSFRFLGHSNKITCASLSQDEYYIVTGSVDRTVKLWCLRLNIVLATFKSHTKTIWDVHFNPSGLYFLSGGADGLMLLWKTDSHKPQRMFVHKQDIYKVRFAKNPSYVISAGQEGLLKIWDILSAKVIASIRTVNPIINFSLGHSGIYIATIETDGRVTLHNTATGVIIASFYFYFKMQGEQFQRREIIHDACWSEDENEFVCVTNKHILQYSMHSLQLSMHKAEDCADGKVSVCREKTVVPELVLMSMSPLRFNYCRFRHRNLLVVGATSYIS